MKVGIVGAGTAGLYCAIDLLETLPEFVELDLIYSDIINPIEIGESTLVNFPHSLAFGIDYIHHLDFQELNSTIKHGVKFKNWNGVGFIPFASGSYGLQFDTSKFPEFVIPRLHERYPKFSEKIRTVKEIKSLGKKVSVDGEEYDYVVDCRGFPRDYSDYVICDNVYLNAAFTTRSSTPGTWDYTYHIAHKNGWMFGLPLQTRTGWGYLYNSNLTHRDEAFAEFLTILDEYQIEAYLPEVREFSFKNYYAKSIVNEDGNIFLNGNRALFLEPIQATSLGCYGLINDMIKDAIVINKKPDQYFTIMEEVVRFINLHYYNGSDFDSPFWNTASEGAKKLFGNSDPREYNWEYVLDWNPQFTKKMFENFL